MAAGCVPVVSAVESGIPEIVSNGVNGRIAGVGMIGDFATAIQELAERRDHLDRMATEARRSIVERGFDSASMTQRYVELIRRVRADIGARSFLPDRTSAPSPVPPTLRDRIAAPLWSFSQALRRQQGLSG
jgi:hypothetical protein